VIFAKPEQTDRPHPSASPTTPSLLHAIRAYVDQVVLEIAVIQRGYGGARFVPFHINGGKSPTISGEYVTREFQVTDYAVLFKEGRQTLFGGFFGQATDG
jgi:hypothetical protein